MRVNSPEGSHVTWQLQTITRFSVVNERRRKQIGLASSQVNDVNIADGGLW